MNEQLKFDIFPVLPPDEITFCTSCGRLIILQRFTLGMVSSEFVSEKGECFKCSRK